MFLSGYSKTVDFYEKIWIKNPFMLTKINNKFYRLEIVDIKYFFVFILKVISSINLKNKKPIYIFTNSNEETDISRARYFIKSRIIKLGLHNN